MTERTVIDVINTYNIKPEKKLGQNFITDPQITDQIVYSIGDIENQTILEIGPGPGALTRSLLASKAKKVIAIEADERCIKALSELEHSYKDKLELIHADALRVDYSGLNDEPMVLVANLPYNIGTALVLKWLENPSLFSSINVMLQKEVVDRICAKPSTSDYGRLSIICQLFCDTEELMLISPDVFYPAPKVMSSVVRLTPLKNQRYECDLRNLELVTNKAFSQRRKMLRSALKGLLTEEQILEAGISPQARAEQLSIEEFCKLARILK